eukprot:Em0006g254a
MDPTGDVAVCKGSVATFHCSYTDGMFPHFELNDTDVSMYSVLNVTFTHSGTNLYLKVPGELWSDKAIIRCVVSGNASVPAVLHVQGPPPLAPLVIRCLSNDKVQLTLPSTNVPESGYGIAVSRNGAPLLSNNTTKNESVFMMEGCYQCYPCQVNITPFCGNTVGNSVIVMLSQFPAVTPPTLGSSITGSTNDAPTTAAPTDDIISVPVLVALVVTVIALPVIIIIIIIIITILVFANRRRTGGLEDGGGAEGGAFEELPQWSRHMCAYYRNGAIMLPQSPQVRTPLIHIVSPEEVSSYQHPPGPLSQHQRDIEHIPSGELTSPPPIANATTSFQVAPDEDPQPIDQPKTIYVYLTPTPGLKATSDSDVVTVTTNSHPAEGRDDQRAEVFL